MTEQQKRYVALLKRDIGLIENELFIRAAAAKSREQTNAHYNSARLASQARETLDKEFDLGYDRTGR